MFITDALRQVGDAEIFGAMLNGCRRTSRDPADGDTGFLQHTDAGAIERVKGFGFATVWQISQLAVGQHAIDIEGHEFEILERVGHLDHLGAEQIMHIQRAFEHTIGIGHDELIDAVFFHECHGFNREAIGADGLRRGGHDVANAHLL